jgi:tRNA A-37 threonylcarbamoyl transferase component Bud32
MSWEIPPEALRGPSRVFKFLADGETVIVKKKRKPDVISAHIFQNLLARISKDPIWIRTDAPRGAECGEINKLRALRSAGVNVPRVLHEAGEYFVLEYVGPSVDSLLARTDDASLRESYVADALEALRDLHERGFIHGGAQVKNFTFYNGAVYLIDFEEVIPRGHLEKFIIRDILIFMLSLEKRGFDRRIDWICGKYDPERGHEISEVIEETLLKYKLLKFLGAKIFSHIKMDDVRAALSLVEKAEASGKSRRIVT